MSDWPRREPRLHGLAPSAMIPPGSEQARYATAKHDRMPAELDRLGSVAMLWHS